jgi:hypothetical protein
MPWHDHEQRRAGADALVLLNRKRHGLGAVFSAALADEVDGAERRPPPG